MKSISVQWRVWLGITALAVIVAAVAVVRLVGSDEGSSDKNGSGQPQTGSIPAGSDSPSPDETRTQGTNGTTSTQSPGTKPDGPRTGPFGSPDEGRFRYKVTNSSPKSTNPPQSSETILEFHDLSSSKDELKQSVDFRPRGGNSSMRHQTRWSTQGTHLLSERVGGEDNEDCDWEPDILELKAPLEVGEEWSSKSSCTTMSQGKSTQRSRNQTSRVMERTTLEIGGVTFEIFVIHKVVKDSSSSEGVTGVIGVETDSTDQFAPALGLNARMTNRIKITFLGETREAHNDWELLGTKPS